MRARRITPGETLKTFTKRAVTTLATLALALSGALATAVPATAATSKKVTGPEITTEGTRSTVRVTTKDVKIKKGKFTAKDWLKIRVDVPDSFDNADGTRVDATWWASISYPKGSSTTTCGSGGVTDTYSGDGTYVAGALKSRGLEKKSFGYYYHGAGRCTFDVKVYISRAGDYTQGIASYYETIAVKNVSYNNIAPSKTSISSATKVKKNKSFKVSGVATYQNPAKRFANASVKKGTKVEIQYRKNNKGAWKTIRTTKVGKSGKWSTSIKLKAKGSIRAVVKPTTVSQQATSATKKISLR